MSTEIHPEAVIKDAQAEEPQESKEDILKTYIREHVIGRDMTFKGPFGRKPVLYCDWFSSGIKLKNGRKYFFNCVFSVFLRSSFRLY
jgi:hypothetical protein